MADIRSIADLKPDGRNRRKHTPRNIGMIVDALHQVGAARSVVIDEHGMVLAGNGVIEAAAQAGIERVQVVDADGETIVAVRRSNLDAEGKRKLALFDNRTAELATWDAAQIAADVEASLSFDGVFYEEELAALVEDAAREVAEEAAADDDDAEAQLTRGDVPDALWPTDNEWGVPMLDARMQAQAVDMPVTKWGTIARSFRMPGTWHFYTDDYKFSALWDDPSPIANSRCVNVVEPNFSTNPDMPRAVVLWGIYRKRWLSRWWQSYGVRVFVDMNVDPCFADLNMLGVPAGYRAYAMRWLDRYGEDDVVAQWRLAQERAGGDVLLLVIGGRAVAEAACQAHGWVWIKEHAGMVNDG